MSWFTDFRDAALIGAGLKKGGNAARTLGNVTRPTFQNATAPEPVFQPKSQPNRGGFSVGQTLKDNKWIPFVIFGAGALMAYKAVKS